MAVRMGAHIRINNIIDPNMISNFKMKAFCISTNQIGKQFVCNHASHMHERANTNACNYKILISTASGFEIFGFERSSLQWSIVSRTCLLVLILTVELICHRKNLLEVRVRFLRR